ncbi:MAG: hypothetical protein C0601_02625 [Candidatus Muiribacterium halophilum]|uniref:Lipoprotein n=1 Tax=Muiribacterium halophilum TaxID=2053465 RepID=A0A2N5ZKM4_MUIH1|nr:MAG: hypothetical protein C0601_02625 [Candidatus Muirbacterium halophilum]
MKGSNIMKKNILMIGIIISLFFLISCQKKTQVGKGIEFIGEIRPEYSDKKAINEVGGDIIEDRGQLKIFSLDKKTETALIFSNPKILQRICFANCKILEGAIEMYNMDETDPDNVIKSGKVPEKISKYLSHGKLPACPSGGEYTYSEKTGVLCSIHGNIENNKKLDEEQKVGVVAYAWKEIINNSYKIKEIYEKDLKEIYQILKSDEVANNLYFLNEKPDYKINFINTVEEKNYKEDKFQAVIDGKASIYSNFITQRGELVFTCQKEFFRNNNGEELYFILGYNFNK